MKNAVLITGGAKRLGSLIAQQLSKEDYFIIIHYNESENEAIRTKEKILENGGDVALIKKNIKSALDASELILEALSFVKKNSVNQFTLINNASAFILSPEETQIKMKGLVVKNKYNQYLKNIGETRKKSSQYNKSCLKGDYQVTYKFNENVLNGETDIEISRKGMKLRGFKKPIKF